MYFGKRQKNLCKLRLNQCDVDWVDKWPYLGIVLHSNKKFDCCILEKIKKFYRASNHIFRIDGKSNDLLMLRLIESHCIPILTYGVEVISIADQDTRRQLRVAYNSVFRRIFNYRQWQSVRELQSFLARPTWEELLGQRSKKFLNGIRNDPVLKALFVSP